jgi:hypothetical protein
VKYLTTERLVVSETRLCRMEYEDSAVDYVQILGTCELGIVLFKTLFILGRSR